MTQERRREGRKELHQPIEGELRLIRSGNVIAVKAIIDVSPTGIGVLIDDPLELGSPIEVAYKNAALEIFFPGIVIWTKQRIPKSSNHGGYATGIHLLSPTLLHTFLQQTTERAEGDG